MIMDDPHDEMLPRKKAYIRDEELQKMLYGDLENSEYGRDPDSTASLWVVLLIAGAVIWVSILWLVL